MIPNRADQIVRLTEVITGNIGWINAAYGAGPDLHFYRRVRALRQRYLSARAFIESYECVEILYAALVAWGMNSRSARMKRHTEFWQNLQDSIGYLEAVEATVPAFTWANRDCALRALADAYDVLDLMQTNGKLVSNSKGLHFLFPSLCMPMERAHTLVKLYGNTAESGNKFLEVLAFCYDAIGRVENPERYLDDQWNSCEAKLVDNAIILM